MNIFQRYFDERTAIRSGAISGIVGLIFGGPPAALAAAVVSGLVNGFLSDPIETILVKVGVPGNSNNGASGPAGTASGAATESLENIL